MDKHVTVLGALFLALGIMGLIGMTVVLVIFSIVSAVLGTAAANEPDVPAGLAFLPVGLGAFIGLLIAISAVPSLIAGYGLLQKRRWARSWALIAGILNLPGMPLGTGVGIYAIWLFVQEGTSEVLNT